MSDKDGLIRKVKEENDALKLRIATLESTSNAMQLGI